MPRHPDYLDRYLTICCEQQPADTGRLAYACVRRVGHFGDHVAEGDGGAELARWPNTMRLRDRLIAVYRQLREGS
jgi:hypothetical protein